MGHYVTSSDVLDLRAVSIVGVSEDTVDTFIAGVEGQVDTALTAQGYPTVPATGATDYVVIRQLVLQKVAALSFAASRTSDELPAWVRDWSEEFDEWLLALRKGDITLINQSPTSPGSPRQAVRVHRLRVIPQVEEED